MTRLPEVAREAWSPLPMLRRSICYLVASAFGLACSADRTTIATKTDSLVSASSSKAKPAEADVAFAQPSSRFEFEEVHFGNIPVKLTLYARDCLHAKTAARMAFARVAELSAMMSDYAFDPPSPLNRIAAESSQAVQIPPELFRGLARAVDHHRFTGGAFDITAKPFVQLWRVSRRLGELPPGQRLQQTKALVDIAALELDPSASTARLARVGMWLDLGGLAKGMIGDEVVRLLRGQGVMSCRYHAGGDMVFGDAPPGRQGWKVQVVDFPVDDAAGGGTLTFWACNSAVSVSGDVFRFVEIDGVRYAHVIDPRTGLGVTKRRIACVQGLRGIDTDPLATAGLILDEASWRAALAKVPGCRGWVTRVAD